MRASISRRIGHLRNELLALTGAMFHPRTPWYAKAWLVIVVAYAVSPLDLIPDPIPVLGYLDDAILLPLGIAVAIRLIPRDVMDACRAGAAPTVPRALRYVGAALVVIAWVMTVAAIVVGVVRWT